MKVRLVKGSPKYDQKTLYNMRAALIKHIDPLKSAGNELQEVLMDCNRRAMGEDDGLED